MDEVRLGSASLAYELQGNGETVVFLHARPFVGWYRPLIERLAGCSTLLYHRDPPERGPFTIADDARLCIRLMDHVGCDDAHLVGHSYGALVALQLALDAPARVRSLALLEPAARGISSSEKAAAALRPVLDAHSDGDDATAMDLFLRSVGGAGYRAALDRALPDAFATAVAHADTFFGVELPAVQAWTFGPDQARRIDHPLLNVRGSHTADRFVGASDLVQTWFPRARPYTLVGASHLLMVERPEPLAEALTAFHRHPAARTNS
jgi:pimeloyl-ACP methyl ester carboxylesterase